MMKARVCCVFFFLLAFMSVSAQYRVETIDSTKYIVQKGVEFYKLAFRGLSVVDDSVIWASGNRGTVAMSQVGGKHFQIHTIRGYEKSDFRDVEAFDAQHAVIMSSGTPACILVTSDAGQSWKETFRDNRPEMFLDAMDFWDRDHGIIVGDPVNRHFLLLET